MTATEFAATSLHDFYAAVLVAGGVRERDAELAAAGIVFADRRGVGSHGAANLERVYVRGLLDGKIDPAATPRLVSSSGAVAVLDARRALGFIGAHAGMQAALARAEQYGAGAVAIRNSSHCGSMSFYTQQAADAGMIGMAFTNLGSQAIVRPPRGAVALLGTNALAAAAPADGLPSFSLDMSTTVGSAGRIRTAARNREQLPPGWLVDDQGRDVHDPQAYLEGLAHLQFLGGGEETGGYKGYGLALLCDVLCGVLSGAAVGPLGAVQPDGGIGQFMLALNVAGFVGAEQFAQRIAEMLRALTESTPLVVGRPVIYPGVRESNAERTGTVTVSAEVLASLARVAARFGVPLPEREVAAA